jgi:uncharacterized protein YjbI with pentapeptide repeats
MLAFNHPATALSTEQKIAALKQELGLDKTASVGGTQKQVTDLKFEATQDPTDASRYLVKVSMSHAPSSGKLAEYSVTFDNPFTASSATEAESKAVDSFYELMHSYATQRVATPNNEEAALADLALGNASHVFNGLFAGQEQGSELNPSSEAHRILNASGFGHETLKNVVWTAPNSRRGHSLIGLNLADPHWEGVSARKANFAGSVIAGRGIFENCDFSGTRWSGTKFCPATGSDPFSESYDARKCTDETLWTTFRSCNLDDATFAYRGGDGMQGAVTFDKECSLRGASLMHLGPKTSVRIEILDTLREAIACTTVKPGDPRPVTTAELQEERKKHIDALLKQAQTQLKGVMWDESLIAAVGDRGHVYRLLLMRISRVAQPADVIDRIQKAEIAPSQLVDLLRETPGVTTTRRFSDRSDPARPEEVIEISGKDMQGLSWEAEVRVATKGDYKDTVRVTGPGGRNLDETVRTPQALRDHLHALNLADDTPDLFDTYEAELERVLGQFNVKKEIAASNDTATYTLDMGAGILLTLVVEKTKADPLERYAFLDAAGQKITKPEEALLSTILDPLAVQTDGADACLELLKRLGQTRGSAAPIRLGGWTYEVS